MGKLRPRSLRSGSGQRSSTPVASGPAGECAPIAVRGVAPGTWTAGVMARRTGSGRSRAARPSPLTFRRFGPAINMDEVFGTHRWRPWSQKNASVAKKSLRMSTCTTAPPAFPKRTWGARNDSSVFCASMSRSPVAMARRVFLSRSTKWRRDDEPPEPQARCPSRIPAGRGLSVESIMADHVIAARSERAVRCAASRWGLALGIGSPFTIWHRILAPPPAACSSWPSSCWRCIRCRPASDNNPRCHSNWNGLGHRAGLCGNPDWRYSCGSADTRL
jgi:hypothetical protein